VPQGTWVPHFKGGSVRSLKFLSSTVAVACLGIAAARTARGQVHFGPQLNWASNGVGFGVGGRVEASLAKAIPTAKGLGVIGTFDVYFPSGATGWALSGSASYHFDITGAKVAPYVGGGLTILHGTRTGAGLNLLAGTDFPALGKVTPFGELRILLVHGTSAFALSGGVLF
jgi:hypothetical protein